MCSLESAKASSRLRLSTWLTPASRNHLPGSTKPGSFFSIRPFAGRPPGRVNYLDLPGGRAASMCYLIIDGSLSIADATSLSTLMGNMRSPLVVEKGPVFSPAARCPETNSRRRACHLSTWLHHQASSSWDVRTTQSGSRPAADRLGPAAAQTLQRHRRLHHPLSGWDETSAKNENRFSAKILSSSLEHHHPFLG